MSSTKINIAVFASGAGSNARKILEYFQKKNDVQIALIASSRKKAGVVQIAEEAGVPVLFLEKEIFSTTGYIEELKQRKIDFVILAGFLWMVPKVLIRAYPDKIINIHPALLPAYGGKGMYGNAVHEAVIAARETESGITIHLVDEFYDNGRILFQDRCVVEKNDTADILAKKIHALEHKHFPTVIEQYIRDQKKRND